MARKIRSIEVVEIKTKKVVHRVNVEGKTQSSIDRCESGMMINMNLGEYFTRQSSRAAEPRKEER